MVIEYRRGEGHLDRLPALAADLVARKVHVIVTQGGDASSLAAKNATSTIPILFHTASDPVAIGLVTSFARPGGNLTGVSLMYADLMPKLLELLLELVPRARVIALLVLPDEPSNERIIGHMQEAARAKRVDLRVLKARTESETDAAFATLVQAQADGLVLGQVAFRPQNRGAGITPCRSGDRSATRFFRSRRPHQLWPEHYRRLSPEGHLRR